MHVNIYIIDTQNCDNSVGDVAHMSRGVARLTLMVGHTFYNTTYLLLYLMACWFIRAFIYGCFKKCKVRVAITKLV